MCNGSMRILRALPDAPAPTKPLHVVTRQDAQEAAHWLRVAEERRKNPQRFVQKESKLTRKMYDERRTVAQKKHAAVIAMAMEGKRSEQIAAAVGYSYKTVEGIIYRARKRGKNIPQRSRWKEVKESG